MTRMFFVTAVIALLVPLASGFGLADEPDNARAEPASIEIVFVPPPAAVDSASAPAGSSQPAGPANPAAAPPSGMPSEPGKEYTSLIVEVDGLKLERSMSPKLRYASGVEVWGTVKVDYDVVEERGIVGYCTNPDEALKNSRSGSNPLILKAIGVAGVKFHSDPVLSDADAALLLSENAKSKFLDKLNVVFVNR